MIENVGGHSVETSLLQPGGWVLDAGCRDFLFSRAILARGCQVVALDPDPEVARDVPVDKQLLFLPAGLSTKAGRDRLILMQNPEMRHLSLAAGYSQWRHDIASVEVDTITLTGLMHLYGVSSWDCVKLDIEGSEYELLRSWQPLARQITVEFHEHMESRPKSLYDEIYAHLGRWYDVARDIPGDTLFVMKEGISCALV